MKEKLIIVAIAAFLILSGIGTVNASVIVEKIEFLTDAPNYELSPVWTADSNKIMYVFLRTEWNQMDSYIMNSDGTNKIRTGIGEGNLVVFHDLSPDGTNLLITKTFGHWYDLFKVNINTGLLTPIANDPSRVESDGYWSPDGKKIAYSQRDWDNPSELWVMDFDGTNKHRLGTSYMLAYGKDWSPDGSKIIYSAINSKNEPDLYMINSDGTNQTQITDTPYREWYPSFSPNGQYIVYASQEESTLDTCDLWLISLEGNYKVRLTNNIGIHDANPHWSPDGTKILFVGNHWKGGDNADIAVITLIIDSDKDGIPDELDNCPTQDSTGFDADNNGCIDTLNGLNQIILTLPNDVLSDETKNSLVSKVENAKKSADKDADNAAINQLNAFINEVKAQRGNKISEDVADTLINYAQNIIVQIETG